VNKPFTLQQLPNRQASDVISIYSSKYADYRNYFPNWGQGQVGYGAKEFDLNGDKMLNYIKLSYQGIALADKTINVRWNSFTWMYGL
jgi:hypothetical protein